MIELHAPAHTMRGYGFSSLNKEIIYMLFKTIINACPMKTL